MPATSRTIITSLRQPLSTTPMSHGQPPRISVISLPRSSSVAGSATPPRAYAAAHHQAAGEVPVRMSAERARQSASVSWSGWARMSSIRPDGSTAAMASRDSGSVLMRAAATRLAGAPPGRPPRPARRGRAARPPPRVAPSPIEAPAPTIARGPSFARSPTRTRSPARSRAPRRPRPRSPGRAAPSARRAASVPTEQLRPEHALRAHVRARHERAVEDQRAGLVARRQGRRHAPGEQVPGGLEVALGRPDVDPVGRRRPGSRRGPRRRAPGRSRARTRRRARTGSSRSRRARARRRPALIRFVGASPSLFSRKASTRPSASVGTTP